LKLALLVLLGGCDTILGLTPIDRGDAAIGDGVVLDGGFDGPGAPWNCGSLPIDSTWRETALVIGGLPSPVVSHPTIDAARQRIFLEDNADIYMVSTIAATMPQRVDMLSLAQGTASNRESSPSLTSDGGQMYFNRDGVVMTAERGPQTDSWMTSVVMTLPVGLATAQVGTPSAGGDHGTRMVVSQAGDLRELVSGGSTWSEIPTLAQVNRSDSMELDPFLTADGCWLLFSSNRGGTFDLFAAQRGSDGVFSAPALLPFMVSDSDERGPAFAPSIPLVMFERNGTLYRATP
jgi:hypothetical protein